jgi:uncharacterized protein with GYD domain
VCSRITGAPRREQLTGRRGLPDGPGQQEAWDVYARRLVPADIRGPQADREDPEYLDKIHKIVEEEGGKLERFMATMGPWEYIGIFTYPDNEIAFRVLGKIAKLEIFETETFPAEDVEIFFKTLV